MPWGLTVLQWQCWDARRYLPSLTCLSICYMDEKAVVFNKGGDQTASKSLWKNTRGTLSWIWWSVSGEKDSIRRQQIRWASGVCWSSANLFIVIISLVSLLRCVVLASKSIHNMISLNIPLALSCCYNFGEGQKPQCCSIGDHVLKCWISVRASQPEHIMVGSVFSSFVGLVVTGCIVFQVVD